MGKVSAEDAARHEAILDKVGKLLRKAEGTTFEAEAQAFYAKAQRILLENGLSMAQVDSLSKEQQEGAVEKVQAEDMGGKLVDWKLNLAWSVFPHFRCRHYLHRIMDGKGVQHVTIWVVGLADDAAVAAEVYSSACKTLPVLAWHYTHRLDVTTAYIERYHGGGGIEEYSFAQLRVMRRKMRAAYYDGFMSGLAAKFKEQVAASESLALALVIHPVVNERFERIVGRGKMVNFRSSATRGYDDAARQAGYDAGKNFEPIKGHLKGQ